MSASASTAIKAPTSPDEEPTVQDNRRMQYVWLCQVCYAGRMIALGQCPVICISSTKPEHQIQRALQVLLNIVRSQIDEDADYSATRLGSCTTWFQQRYYFGESPDELLDALEIDENDSIDPADEIFPERASPGPPVQITDRLCVSRFQFLADLKRFLYCLQDREMSMESTWQELWTYFMVRMGGNEYLLEYQGGSAAVTEWARLDQFQRARFLNKTFRLDRGALTWWLQAHPDSIRVIETPMPSNYTALADQATLREIHIFASYVRDLPDYFMDYVINRGYEDTCTCLEGWYEDVHDRSQLSDSNCMVCFLEYELSTEVTIESQLPIHEPVKLACGHQVCLPCLRSWAQSHAVNHNKCPFCRAQASPANPSEKLQEIFMQGVAAFYANASPTEGVADLLLVFDTFFSGLPVSIPSLHIALTEESDILGSWISNITCPVNCDRIAFEFATSLADDPSLHIDMQAWAALKALYWSCQRLRSFKTCDADGFRLACQAQFRARVLFETLAFASKLFDALLDFDDEDEDEDDSDI